MEKSVEISFVDSIASILDLDKLYSHVIRKLDDQLDKLNKCRELDHDDISNVLSLLRGFCFIKNRDSRDINCELQIKLKECAFLFLQKTDASSKDVFGVACELFAMAIEVCDQNNSEMLIDMLLAGIIDSLLCILPEGAIKGEEMWECDTIPTKLAVTEKRHLCMFSVDSVVELLCYLLDNSSDKTNHNSNKFLASVTASDTTQSALFARIKTLLVKAIFNLSEHLLIKFLLELLPKINAGSPDAFESLVNDVWNEVMESFNAESEEVPKCNLRGYLILSCVCDHIFSPCGSRAKFPVWANCQFWAVLQNSLVHENPLQRKRALYFLKRALDSSQNQDIDIPASSCGYLFSWKCDRSDEIQKAFDNIILVLETVEEKQVHVMKPLFPLVRSLLSLTIENETWFLHTSWLTVIFQRLMQHDSKTIKKWTIEMICNINLSDFPLFIQKSEKFFWSSFLEGLNDNALYARQPNEPLKTCADIGNQLMEHYRSCHGALKTDEKRASFFQQILKNLQNQSWGSVPLLYVTRALTFTPPGPLWNSASVRDLREILTNSLRAHETVIRGAIQSFLLEAFIHMIDMSDLTITDLSLLLGTFKKECLQRGTGLYADLALWLHGAICASKNQAYEFSAENMLLFLKSSLRNILENDQGVTIEELKDSCEISRIARMMVLLFDANVSHLHFNEGGMHSCLENVIETLKTCHTRTYMKAGKAEKCLAFLITLAVEAELDGNTRPADLDRYITSIFEEVLPSILSYVTQKLFSDVENNKNFGNVQLYFLFLQHLTKNVSLHVTLQPHLLNLCLKSITEFQKKKVEQNTFLQHYIAVKCFHVACLFVEISSNVEIECANVHLKDFMNIYLEPNMLFDFPKDKSKISFADKVHKTNHNHSDYIAVLWSCASFCVQKCNFLNATDREVILQQSLKAMQVCSDTAFKPIFTCLESCLEQITETDTEKVVSTLEVCWKTVSNMKINAAFWDAMNAFIKMAFQQSLISNIMIVPHLSKYAESIAERSESCHGLFLLLVRRLASIWKMPDYQLSMLHYMSVVVQALTFGHIHRRDQRISQDTVKFLSQLGDYYSQIQVSDRSSVSDSEVRVEAVILLLNLRESPHRDNIISALLQSLIEFEIKITKSRSRHFANSLIHRVKQRVWQTLLVLQPLFTQELAENLMDTAFKMVIEESLQPSVRYLMEWIIMKILHKFPAKLQKLWSAFESATQSRVGSLGSFLTIICHLGRHLCSRDEQISFIANAIPVILPWCMAQHFNTRIYGQVALHKLWTCCMENHFEAILEKYSPMESLFTIDVEHGGTSKGIHSILADYQFNAFHHINHYSISTIFYELPRLSNVTEEEWIEPEVFLKCDQMGLLESPESHIPLYNRDTTLSNCVPGSWVNRSTADGALTSDAQETKDVQRKITPWKQMIPDYEALAAASQSIAWKKQQNADGLIVVASLIDRAPNLGGLCRTCEVFGVTTYVIGSLRYTEDKQFQSLSVSADRWVRIEEVKPQDLRDYLLTLRKRGYTIIGAEQTANSCKLGSYTFPKKTVLLLGNEKEGIPVELIQLLDVCLEIPQEGLIRSLNVHVTGAILIWEYARQKHCS